MKRYLRRLFAGGAIIIMVLNVLVCSLVFIAIMEDNARTSLKTVINAFFLLETPGEEECQAIAEQLAGMDGMEAAFIREDGLLIASASEAGGAEVGGDCSNDADVKQALRSEWGEATRISAESGAYTMYMTRRIGDGLLLRLGYPMTAINTFLMVMLAAAALLSAAVILTMRFLAGRLTDRLLKPLHQVNDLLHSTHAAQPTRQDEVFEEVQPLMDNISAMIRKLHYDFEEINRTQQMRRDFVANASHELKSPLTSIKGFAELLQAGMGGTEAQQKEYLGRIVRESNRLLAIIEDILQLNRAESGEPEDVQAVDLRAVCDEAVQALESIAAKKHIRMDVAGHGKVMANAQEMWELVYNLVDNGIRYGREDGFVNVRVDRNGLTVIDNGIGMEQDQLPRIFERFYRVDNSHARPSGDGMPGGTGLGLSIVKHIALKYGGDVSVISAPGEGTTFIVRFADDLEAK